jgi:ABC-2 type transport system ATP-binding protein
VVALAVALAALTLPSAHATPASASAEPPLISAVEAVDPADRVRVARGEQTWTTKDFVVPTVTGPEGNIDVDIAATRYVPASATREHPAPAILMTHGFGLTKDSPEVVSTARFFAAHGYVVVTYTSAGFGTSGGCVTLQSVDYDTKSASQVITKLLDPLKLVAHDRRGAIVGTIGGSYGGGVQLPLAATDRRIHTAIPGRTWNYLGYSLDPNNRVVPGKAPLDHQAYEQGVFKAEWTSLFYALGNSMPAQQGGDCPGTKAATGDPVEIAAAGACPGYYLPLCQTYAGLAATGDATSEQRKLIARASAANVLDRIKIPVMLVQGQSDTLFNVNDAASTFLSLRSRGIPVSMIWNSGGHGGYVSQPGECEAYDGTDRVVEEMDACYLPLRALRWMNYWLRGKGSPGPSFTYFRDWVAYNGSGPDDEQYGVKRFTLGGGTTFALDGTGSLLAPGEGVPELANALIVNPPGGVPAAFTETSNFTGPMSSPYLGDLQPQEIPGQFAAFTSEPFADPVEVVGIPSAHLAITNSNGQDMVFFAKVYDVGVDGSAELIHRLISPVRVPAEAAGEPVDLKLAGFAHRFEAGHSVRLVICTTDLTSYNAKVTDLLTITTGGQSTFTLPMLTVPTLRPSPVM